MDLRLDFRAAGAAAAFVSQENCTPPLTLKMAACLCGGGGVDALSTEPLALYHGHITNQALDESHTISDKSGTLTNVYHELVSNRRWCITGTPFNSRFSDVAGQLAFIGADGVFSTNDLGGQM